MNELEAKVTSKQIADFTRKEHRNICRKIEKMIAQNGVLVENQHVTESTYEILMPVGGGTRKYKMYELDKVGFDTVLLSFTGEEGDKIRANFACVFETTVAEKRKDELTIQQLNDRIDKAANLFLQMQNKLDQLENTLKYINFTQTEPHKPRVNTLNQIAKSIGCKLPELKDFLANKNLDGFYIVKQDQYGQYKEFTFDGVKFIKAAWKSRNVQNTQFKEVDADKKLWETPEQMAERLQISLQKLKMFLKDAGFIRYNAMKNTIKATAFTTSNNYGKNLCDNVVFSPTGIQRIEYLWFKVKK